MQKGLVGCLCLGLVVLFNGCEGLAGMLTKNDKGLANVIIALPKADSRSVGITATKTYTKYFEVAFKNKTNSQYFFANAMLPDGYIQATIPDGIYDILLFAGDKDYYSNYSPLLLATSYATDVNITLDGPNVVNMPLATFDFDLTVSSKVIFGNNYTINITVDTKNPLITTFLNGGLQSDDYYSGGNVDIPIDGSTYTKNGTVFSYSHTLTAPLSDGSKIFNFFGYIRMFSQNGTSWSYGTTAHPSLGSNYKGTVSFVAGADVGINITWPDE